MSPSQFFLSEDSKNALTKEMVDIVLGKATGCLTTQKTKKGFSLSVCQCQLTKFLCTDFSLRFFLQFSKKYLQDL